MRAVIQRVKKASVLIEGNVAGEIGCGLLVFVGIEDADNDFDINWLSKKITALRIFNDKAGVMNLDIKQTNGDILVVSQFTLFADIKRGNRPYYGRSSKPDYAVPMYEKFIKTMEANTGKKIQTGIFGADMEVSLVNDGPVTIWMDSKNIE